MMRLTGRRAVGEVDSGYAWLRLLAGVLTSTIGGVGMCSIAVVLPTLQADFGDGVRPGFLRKGDRDDRQLARFDPDTSTKLIELQLTLSGSCRRVPDASR